MMSQRAFTPRAARRLLLRVCLALACSGLAACTWLEGEFATLDPLPPSCRDGAPDAPPPALVQRP